MVLTEPRILELLRKAYNEDAIVAGEKLQKSHKVHVTGEGYENLVVQIKGFESAKEFSIRKQISKPATISISSIILDNLNRWVNAQGTVKKAEFYNDEKNKQFNDVLDQCWHGDSFDAFIKTFYKEAIYTEFNGFVLVTKPKILEGGFIEKEGMIYPRDEQESLNPYLIFISNSSVHDYFLSGDRVEYLIIKLDDKGKRFRLIDDAQDSIIDYDNDKITGIDSVPNEIGYVPAMKISTINEKLTKTQVKTSPVNHIIPALDRYFSSDADLRIQFIKHAYPKLAIVVRPCTACNGLGFTYKEDETVFDISTRIKCNTCDGEGKEIPISRDGVIGIPQYLANGDTPYPGSPASYITPDTESLRLCIEDLEKQRKDVLYAGTGDKGLISENVVNETATAILTQSKSLEDRISEIISMVEKFETFIKICIKDLHKDFTNIKDYVISVRYGRRLTLKGETELLDEMQKSKSTGMPSSFIQALQKDLIYAKYKNNSDELQRQLLLADVEPFAGYTIEEILKFESKVNPDDIILKANFDALLDQFEAENMLSTFAEKEVYKKRIILIKEKLLSYAVLQRPGTDTLDAG